MSELRVLFVDDEPRVLQSIRRDLSLLELDWETRFVQDGATALEVLATDPAPFHVIVTDMRMPGMNGEHLLKHVQDRHPDIIRIVLTGQANLLGSRSLDAFSLAHQYLTKPCEMETLVATLRRAHSLRKTLANAELRRLIAQIKSLPSPPALYMDLISETEKPDASIETISAIMARDMAMTARVLQMVNSAYFGPHRQIHDPGEAVIYLGFETIRSLALSLHMFTYYQESGSSGAKLNQLHAHAMAVGILARRIAQGERLGKQICSMAFTAGLLHDLGKLVLIRNFPEQYETIVDRTQQPDVRPIDSEREVFGADHAQVGAYLLGLWGLPDPIVEAVAWHHNLPSTSPADATFLCLTDILRTANALVHYEQGDNSYQPYVDEKSDRWRDTCRQLLTLNIHQDEERSTRE
jgi:putative nucleotidyltransferase with HDIG domain